MKARRASIFAVVLGLVLAAPALAGAAQCRKAPGRGLTLANVAAHGRKLVAVGSDGLLASATNPARWTVEPTPVEHDLRGVVWSGRRWVAVGDVGTILRQVGGVWKAAGGIPPLSLRGVAAGGGRVFAAGTAGAVEGSTAPAGTWAPLDSGTENTLWGGTAVGSTLALAGQDTTVVASPPGGGFHTVPTFPRPTDSTEAPRPFLWQLGSDGRRVVAVGDFGAILEGTLAGGLRAVKSPTDEILRGVEHAAGLWVAVGSGGVTLYSRDGRHWRLGTDPTTADLRGVAHTPSGWVAVGDQSAVIASRDGVHWHVAVSAMPCSLLGLAASRSLLVAVGGAGRVLVSFNGGHGWKPLPRPTGEDLYGVAHGRRGFVAVGADGTLLRSAGGGGRSWRPLRVPTKLNLHTAFWTGHEYLAGGDRGTVLASVDSKRWRRVSFPGFHSVRAFATDGETVVAAGAGTIARRAAPGAGWELQSAGFQHFQTGVAYGDGRFVIVGHNGQALVSTDGGLTWSAGKSGIEVNLDTVIWTGSAFLATGEGTAIASADGLTWSPVSVPTHRNIRALVVDRKSVVGVGDGGATIRLSGPLRRTR